MLLMLMLLMLLLSVTNGFINATGRENEERGENPSFQRSKSGRANYVIGPNLLAPVPSTKFILRRCRLIGLALIKAIQLSRGIVTSQSTWNGWNLVDLIDLGSKWIAERVARNIFNKVHISHFHFKLIIQRRVKFRVTREDINLPINLKWVKSGRFNWFGVEMNCGTCCAEH